MKALRKKRLSLFCCIYKKKNKMKNVSARDSQVQKQERQKLAFFREHIFSFIQCLQNKSARLCLSRLQQCTPETKKNNCKPRTVFYLITCNNLFALCLQRSGQQKEIASCMEAANNYKAKNKEKQQEEIERKLNHEIAV